MGQGEDAFERESAKEEIIKNRIKIMEIINVLFVIIHKLLLTGSFNFPFIIREPP